METTNKQYSLLCQPRVVGSSLISLKAAKGQVLGVTWRTQKEAHGLSPN